MGNDAKLRDTDSNTLDTVSHLDLSEEQDASVDLRMATSQVLYRIEKSLDESIEAERASIAQLGAMCADIDAMIAAAREDEPPMGSVSDLFRAL